MDHDVFISYSSRDTETTDAVCRILEENDIKCWIAPRDIPPSQSYGECIIEAIKSSKALVVIFSANSNQSKFVFAEVERAFSYNIPIFPFRLDIIPPSIQLELFLSTKQWQDAVVPPPLEQHILKLKGTISKHLGKSELGVVLPVRAVEDIPVVRRFLDFLELQEEGCTDKLAEAAHRVFCEDKRRDGWTLGPRDEMKKTTPLLKPYSELNELARETRRAKVRCYPAMLAALGYKLVDASPGQPPVLFSGEVLEGLAELEHSIYRMRKLDEGFSPGMATDANPKLLPALVEWEHLRENVKSINRGLVWEMQKIIAQAGFTAVEK